MQGWIKEDGPEPLWPFVMPVPIRECILCCPRAKQGIGPGHNIRLTLQPFTYAQTDARAGFSSNADVASGPVSCHSLRTQCQQI